MSTSLPRSFTQAVARLVRQGHTHAQIAASVARMANAATPGRKPEIPFATIEHIRALAKAGATAPDLARQFRIDVSYLRDVLRGLHRTVR